MKYTEHFRDVGFDIDVLQVPEVVGVEEPDRRIQPDRYPDSVTSPTQLPDLAFFARMSFEASLFQNN